MSNIEDWIEKLCPNGVEYKTLGELGKFYSGITGKSKEDFKEGNAKFITYKNVYENISLKLDVEDKVKISEKENQRTLEYGDIIFTGSSETPDECGLSSVVTERIEEKLYLNSFCFFFRMNNKEILNPDFAKHLFRSSNLRYQIGKTASGVTRFNVSKKAMEKIRIPVPPLEVQCEIVHILDDFTLLSALLSAELSAELKARQKQFEYYKGILFENKNVELKNLNELATNCDNKRKPITSGNREKGKYPYYGASGIVDYVKDYIFDGNYLLISEDGANLVARKTPIAFSISGKNWVNNHVHVLKFNDIYLQKYVEMYLNYINLEQYISGAAQPKLNQENLNKIVIPIPNNKALKNIVDILSKFDKITNDISEGLPAEIEARQKQYEYYRDKLLTFKELKVNE